jgi:8-oxo-dGTP pyrophosphatase MutT (NUDIX family)
MIFSVRTGRFVFSLRPDDVDEAGTWSLWGGKAEPGESPPETALREAIEETGVSLKGELQHLRRKVMSRFFYETYLLIIPDEFEPVRTNESAGYKWVPLDDLPSPLHWGVTDLLGDYTAVKIMTKTVERLSGRPCDFDDVFIP